MQQRLIKNKEIEYHSEFKNDLNDTEQHIRLSDGCFRDCWNCYAPTKKIWYKVRTRGPYIRKRISEILVLQNINVILAGSAFGAAEIATSIMKRVHEKYG